MLVGAEDASANLLSGSAQKTTFSTKDLTAPTLTLSAASSITTTSVQINAQSNEVGSLYYVVVSGTVGAAAVSTGWQAAPNPTSDLQQSSGLV